LIYTYKADWNPNTNTNFVKFNGLAIFKIDFAGGDTFRKCVLPEGLAKELHKIMKIPNSLDLIGYTMVLTIFTWTCDAQTTTDASNTSPTSEKTIFATERKSRTEQVNSGSEFLHVGVVLTPFQVFATIRIRFVTNFWSKVCRTRTCGPHTYTPPPGLGLENGWCILYLSAYANYTKTQHFLSEVWG